MDFLCYKVEQYLIKTDKNVCKFDNGFVTYKKE